MAVAITRSCWETRRFFESWVRVRAPKSLRLVPAQGGDGGGDAVDDGDVLVEDAAADVWFGELDGVEAWFDVEFCEAAGGVVDDEDELDLVCFRRCSSTDQPSGEFSFASDIFSSWCFALRFLLMLPREDIAPFDSSIARGFEDVSMLLSSLPSESCLLFSPRRFPLRNDFALLALGQVSTSPSSELSLMRSSIRSTRRFDAFLTTLATPFCCLGAQGRFALVSVMTPEVVTGLEVTAITVPSAAMLLSLMAGLAGRDCELDFLRGVSPPLGEAVSSLGFLSTVVLGRRAE